MSDSPVSFQDRPYRRAFYEIALPDGRTYVKNAHTLREVIDDMNKVYGLSLSLDVRSKAMS